MLVSLKAGMLGTTHVSFSNVTDADFDASAASDVGVTERVVIFPQKLKKSLTSFSLVCDEMLDTCTVVDMMKDLMVQWVWSKVARVGTCETRILL